jgi:hypothetical protein
MAAPQRLSREDEEGVLALVDRVNDLVEGGAAPTDAVVKAAGGAKLPPGHVRLACLAFNVGRANHARKTAASLLERTEPLPLADAARALQALYPEKGPSPAARQRAAAFSEDYLLPPDWKKAASRRPAPSSLMEKAAAFFPPAPPLQRAGGPEGGAARALADWRRLVDKRETELVLAEDRVKRAFAEAVGLVRGRRLPCGLEKVAEHFNMLTGGPAGLFARHLKRYEVGGAREAAAAGPLLIDVDRRPWSVFKEGAAALLGWEEARRARDEALDRPGPRELRLALFPMTVEKGAAAPGGGPPGDKPPMAKRPSLPPEKKTDRAPSGFLSSFGPALTGAANSVLRSSWAAEQGRKKDPKGDDDKALAALTSPEHEQEMDRARSRFALQDMLSNDETIAGFDPEEVERAYNELGGLAPRAMRQPSLARALLRRHLAQGSLDSHDLEQLLRTEKALKENAQLPGLDKYVPEDVRPVGPVGRGRGYAKTEPRSTLLEKALGRAGGG